MRDAPIKVFVDTNVLIYAEDSSEPLKQERAADWMDALWQRRCGALSIQILNEFYVNATGKIRPPLPQGIARAIVSKLAGWQPWLVDVPTIESAWLVQTRFGLSYWDSLVIASAQQSGCRYVLSEDMQHLQHYGSVQLINPFLVTPQGILESTV